MPALIPILLVQFLLTATTRPAPPAAAAAPAYTRTADVIYGRKFGMALTLDVFTPSRNANHAGVILVVSGGWFSSHDAIDHFAHPWVDRLAARGYTVFAVVHASQPRFTIPEAIDDLNRATRFIHHNATTYHIDPTRLAIVGGSAGGHLSLMQALAPQPPDLKSPDPVDREPAEVAAAAAFFPPTDFLNYGRPGESALGGGKLAWLKPPFDFLEQDPRTHEFNRVTDPDKIKSIGREISPINHVTPNAPPILLIHGDADPLVPLEQSQILLEKLQAAHVDCKLIIKPGAGHGWPHPDAELDAVADWFDQHLFRAATTQPSR